MLVQMGERARAAYKRLSRSTTEDKNRALAALAGRLETGGQAILEANAQDVAGGCKPG